MSHSYPVLILKSLPLGNAYKWGGVASLKDIFGGAYLFPCPAAIGAWDEVPPVFVLYVSAMNPFHLKYIFFNSNGPHKLCDCSFILGFVVLYPKSSMLLGFARINPRDVRYFSVILYTTT